MEIIVKDLIKIINFIKLNKIDQSWCKTLNKQYNMMKKKL